MREKSMRIVILTTLGSLFIQVELTALAQGLASSVRMLISLVLTEINLQRPQHSKFLPWIVSAVRGLEEVGDHRMEVTLPTEMGLQVEDLHQDAGSLCDEITKVYPLSEVTREPQDRDLPEAIPLEEDPVTVLILRRKVPMMKRVREIGS